jgi:antiviral helicase SKI2
LSQNDSKLPQVMTVCEMVQRGIGIHHGGLLPILKEMVEILFSRNLIKVLFATETFAMGVNMPAKAVVFYSIRKHDGSQFRMLEPGEYTQMAGRAGRRGLDDVGTVIICCFGESPPPQPILRQMLTGTSTKLSSQFRLTYNMILNLLRVEEISVESMIKRSFSEFATQRALTVNEYPQLLARGTRTLAKLEEEFQRDDFSRIGAEDLEEYYAISTRLGEANDEVFSYILENDAISFEDLFPTGRILFVTVSRHFCAVCSPSIILRSPSTSSVIGSTDSSTDMVCIILLPSGFVPDSVSAKSSTPGTIGYQGMSQQRYYIIEEVSLDQVRMIGSGKRKTIDAKTLLKIEDKPKTFDAQQSSGFNMSTKMSDPFAGMKAISKKDDLPAKSSVVRESQTLDQVVGYLIDSEREEKDSKNFETFDIQSLVKRGNNVLPVRETCQYIGQLVMELRMHSSHRHPNLAKLYATIARKETLKSKVETLRHLLSNESLQLFPDFLQRKEVLRKLGYVDKDEAVCVKGRVACEVNTCEELVATEMVFEGLLDNLEPEEIAAVLSSLVYQERNDELPDRLVNCCQQLKIIALNLGQMQKEQGLPVDPGEYREKSLNFGLVHVVYEWAMGVPFRSICDLTMAQEGSIVRCITRLDELCREIRNCSRVVGNATLYRKMEAASTAIKRDIVFASSLYIS